VVRGRHRSDYLWDWAGGLSDFERAMALKSNDRLAILGRASFLAALGRGREAMAEARRATDVDPLAPDAWGTLAAGLLASGDLAGAEAAARRGRKVAPAHPFPAFVLSQVLIEGGRATEAIPLLQALPLAFWRLAGLSVAYHRIGKARESQAALDELVEGHARFAAYQIAQVHAVRSDPDAAFDWLEKASRQHDRGLAIVRWDPWLSPLHGDPRWKPFLRKLNLPVD
jgi:serine/threonine-protein kinase